jgi:hypothetical protein
MFFGGDNVRQFSGVKKAAERKLVINDKECNATGSTG